MILRSRDGFKIEKGNLKYMILRATFGTVGILCNFYAVDHLVLSDASMLNKMSPFFVIIFSFLLLKEKMTPAQGLAVTGAFIGSLFVIKPTFTNMALVPSLIGLCGGICAGIAYAMVRILGQRGQKGSSVVIFFSGFSCVVTLPYLILDFHPMSGLQISDASWCGTCSCGWSVRNHGGLLSCTCERNLPSTIIRRLSSLRFSDSSCSDRCRIGIVCWGM